MDACLVGGSNPVDPTTHVSRGEQIVANFASVEWNKILLHCKCTQIYSFSCVLSFARIHFYLFCVYLEIFEREGAEICRDGKRVW